MVPASAPEMGITVAKSVGTWKWNSPIPYLFGGLVAMLFLIALSLVILLCAYYKKSSPTSHEDMVDIEKPAAAKSVLQPLDMEPTIAVISPGDYIPRFLLKPIPFSSLSSLPPPPSPSDDIPTASTDQNNQLEQV
ncbi:hypothetical protein MKW94_019383 [Papaver nudicaule]|uniref:Uncharacterized protein n=1 Tax=Papaver nudicaule TaxID=74823 RepID=A0AA41SFS2_PAPNU|nr:hypothetical protein [Papaver nudicaule]